MTAVLAAPARIRALPAGTALTASAYVGFSAPEALDFLRLLPVGVVLLLVALHLLGRRTGATSPVRLPTPAIVLASWLALTVIWSEGRFITAVQVTSTVLVVAVALVLAALADTGELLRGLVVGGLVVLGLSLAVAVAAPSVGLMPGGYQGGALRGIYVHRNLLAEVLTPALLAALAHRFGGPRPALRKAVVVGVLLGGIVLTHSSTALASIAAGIAVAMLLLPVRTATKRARPAVLVLVAAALVAVGVFAVTHIDLVLGLLGRDSTLTGRALIWEQVRALMDQRPVIGWGWGATWGESDFVRLTVQAVAHFDVPSAHNGYLDAWLQTGAVGLVLFLLLVAAALFRGLAAVLSRGSRLGLWGVLMPVGLLVYNVGEADLVSPLTLLLLAVTLAALTREAAQAKRERADAAPRPTR